MTSDLLQDGTGAKGRLKRWARAARRAAMISLLMQIIFTLAWIIIAFGIGYGVDALSRGEDASLPLAAIIGGALMRALAGWAQDTASARAGLSMVAAARRDIFDTLQHQGAGLLDGESPGTRTSQIIDRTARLSGYAARWLPGRQMALLGPLLLLIAIATQSWLAATLLLFCVLILPGFIWLTVREVTAIARAQQASLDTLSGAFQARAAQAGIIRAFRAVARETDTLQRASDMLRQQTMKVLRVAFLSTAVLEFFASISVAMAAVYVGFKLLGIFPFETGETVTLAEGLTLLILVPEFFAPIRKLSALHHDRADATAAAEQLALWLDPAAEHLRAPVLPAQSDAPEIRFEQVALDFHDGSRLTGLSFNASPGQILALTGPSGSGKTSVLKLLIGQGRLSAGNIRVDGHLLPEGASLAASATWLSQTPWLMEASLEENVRLALPEASADSVANAVIAAGLATHADVTEKLARPLGRGGAGLSGGQRQRIGLARIILRGAPLLLLDEPTAHLDESAEADFIRILKEISRLRTVILATHSPRMMAAAGLLVDIAPLRQEADPC